jgi:hypothetical protein
LALALALALLVKSTREPAKDINDEPLGNQVHSHHTRKEQSPKQDFPPRIGVDYRFSQYAPSLWSLNNGRSFNRSRHLASY